MYYNLTQVILMREALTISLSEDLKEKIDDLAADRGLNRSEVVREALESYLRIEEFRQLRREMVPGAEAQGVYTDEDVFDEVS